MEGKVVLSHSGAFAVGAGTAVRFSPSAQLGIVVLTNAQPTGLAEAVTVTFFDLYQFGKPRRDWLALLTEFFSKLIEDLSKDSTDYSTLAPPTHPAPPKPLGAYVGLYRNDYYGSIEISEDLGSLWMRLPADGALYTLSHWDGDTFIYRYKTDPGRVARGVKFALGGTPKVTVENLAVEGNGTFTRVAR